MENNTGEEGTKSFIWKFAVLGSAVILFPCAGTVVVHNLIDGELVNFLTFGMFCAILAAGFGIGKFFIFGGEALKVARGVVSGRKDTASGSSPQAWSVVIIATSIGLLTGFLIALLTDQLTWSQAVLGYGIVSFVYGLLLRYIIRHDIIDL
ncbi:MAG: hypothetical protein AB8G95_30470 [Anaerolineae bacterium]